MLHPKHTLPSSTRLQPKRVIHLSVYVVRCASPYETGVLVSCANLSFSRARPSTTLDPGHPGSSFLGKAHTAAWTTGAGPYPTLPQSGRASPWETGVLVSWAAFSSTHASTPAGSSYRDINVPWLVRTSLSPTPRMHYVRR